MFDTTTIGRFLIGLIGGVVALGVGVGLFALIPTATSISTSQVVLILLVLVLGLYLTVKLAGRVFVEYNAAKVSVDGLIFQSDGGPLDPGPDIAAADEIVEQIERADDDRHADALVVELNTLGGMPVASSDIHEAAQEFDGPTIAYAKDFCASGGYWVAAGCDEFFARDFSVVGSIGTNFNQTKAHDLAEEHGVHRERFVGGEYKDTLDPLKELTDDEREYVQGLVDTATEAFVDNVAEARDLDSQMVSDTEAKIYFAPEALEAGLVDHVGSKNDLEDLLEDRMGVDEVVMEKFESDRGLAPQLATNVQAIAHAFGQGLASVVTEPRGTGLQFR